MELAVGRNFSKDHPTDATAAFIINEEAAKQLAWSDPLGKMIAMPNIERESSPVIGVLKDFHFRSMREKIGPILFFIATPDWYSVFSLRLRPENVSETLAFLERQWAAFDPTHPFTYTFFDESFAQLIRPSGKSARCCVMFPSWRFSSRAWAYSASRRSPRSSARRKSACAKCWALR